MRAPLEKVESIVKVRREQDVQRRRFYRTLTMQQRGSLALPHIMMIRLFEGLKEKEGYEVRSDIWKALDVAVGVPFVQLRTDKKEKLARKIYEDARVVLDSMGTDDHRQALLGVCMMMVQLIDKGLYKDVRSQVSLVSLLILDEAKEDPAAGWNLDEPKAQDMAKKAIARATMMGYF